MTMGELITYFMIYFFEGTILWKYCTVLFVSENSTKNFLLIQMLYMVTVSYTHLRAHETF